MKTSYVKILRMRRAIRLSFRAETLQRYIIRIYRLVTVASEIRVSALVDFQFRISR